MLLCIWGAGHELLKKLAYKGTPAVFPNNLFGKNRFCAEGIIKAKKPYPYAAAPGSGYKRLHSSENGLIFRTQPLFHYP
jgi:hypothetical protein